MVIPSWHENSVGTVSEGGLRGCLGALSLLYPANDTCHFCSQSWTESGHMGSLATRGAEVGDIQICGERHIAGLATGAGNWGINTDMW